MSFLASFQCPKCKLEKQIYISSGCSQPEVCDDCTQKQKEDEKAFFLYKRARMTVEQRLAAIEEWMYDMGEYQRENCNKFDPNEIIG